METPAPSEEPTPEPTLESTPEPSKKPKPTKEPEPEGTPEPEPAATPEPTQAPEPQVTPEASPLPEAPEETPAPETTPEPTKAPQGTVTTKNESGSLNVRPAPGTDGDPIDAVPNGSTVTILSKSEDGKWTQIEYLNADGETVNGYVWSGYLTEQSGEPDQQPEGTPAPTEPPQEQPAAPEILTDENGEYILDENGSRVEVLTGEDGSKYVVDGEGNAVLIKEAQPPQEQPAAPEILTDENGEYILDENGSRVEVLTGEDGSKYYVDAEGNAVTLVKVEEKAERLTDIILEAPADLALGDTITLRCVLTGFEGVDCTIQWQKASTDIDGNVNGAWADVPGATGETHSFTLTTDSALTAWRVRVETDDNPAA